MIHTDQRRRIPGRSHIFAMLTNETSLTFPLHISRGQYSHAVLDELESQNDAHVEGLSAKVKMLKDVCEPYPLRRPVSAHFRFATDHGSYWNRGQGFDTNHAADGMKFLPGCVHGDGF